MSFLRAVGARRITFRIICDKSFAQGVVCDNDAVRGQKVQGEYFFKVRYVA